MSLVTKLHQKGDRSMSTPGADRQFHYRCSHPQINVNFRHTEEYSVVRLACIYTGRTPREVLVSWARQIEKTEPIYSVIDRS